MASTISVVLSTKTTNDKTESMSITNINPETTNSTLVTFADKIMAFSTNSLTSISKVTKEEVFRNG